MHTTTIYHGKAVSKMPLWKEIKETLILNYYNEDKRKAIKKAASIIKTGGLVAFPTETVYGLGADAFNARAIERIFIAKGRPLDNPLIVHISDFSQVELLASHLPPEIKPLAEKFWPGPLTMILKRKSGVPSAVSAGLSTIAIRVPDHPAALDLIKEAGTPIAAPSANLSGKPSPTESAHVIEDLAGKIEAIVDGGSCIIGLESTVLDLTGPDPVLLRPGGVDREELEKFLKRPILTASGDNFKKPISPGMKYRHYAPRASLLLFTGKPEKIKNVMSDYYDQLSKQGKKVGVLCMYENKDAYPFAVVEILGKQANLHEVAISLYRALRNMDSSEVDVILAESFSEEGIGLALMNRLKKAAEQVINTNK